MPFPQNCSVHYLHFTTGLRLLALKCKNLKFSHNSFGFVPLIIVYPKIKKNEKKKQVRDAHVKSLRRSRWKNVLFRENHVSFSYTFFIILTSFPQQIIASFLLWQCPSFHFPRIFLQTSAYGNQLLSFAIFFIFQFAV